MKQHSQWERFGFALAGLRSAWKEERSFQTEILLFIGVLIFLFIKRPSVFWWVAIVIAAALVMIAELVNTAVENVCDALHPNHHELIGRAKDCASAAVLVSCMLAVLLFLIFLVVTI
jgi:diacylglycerol kinase (ATP)